MFEFIGIGDLHFDKLSRIVPMANDWIAHEVARVQQYAVKHGVRRIVFYGDICERPRMSYEAHIAFAEVLFSDFARKHGLQYDMILGNHDVEDKGTNSMQIISAFARMINHKLRVHSVTTDEEVDGVPVRWCPHPSRKSTTELALNVIHHEVKGSKGDNGRVHKEGSENDHLCVAGHLHTHQKIRSTYFSGTLYQTAFGEGPEKGFHHVRAKRSANGAKAKVDWIPFVPTVELVNLEVHSPKDLRKIDTSTTRIAGKPHPAKLYKLFIQDGIKDLKADFLAGYPNVIRTNVFSTQEELKEMMLEREIDENTDDVTAMFSPLDDLKDFMKMKGVAKPLQKRSIKLHERLLKSFLGG